MKPLEIALKALDVLSVVAQGVDNIARSVALVLEPDATTPPGDEGDWEPPDLDGINIPPPAPTGNGTVLTPEALEMLNVRESQAPFVVEQAPLEGSPEARARRRPLKL